MGRSLHRVHTIRVYNDTEPRHRAFIKSIHRSRGFETLTNPAARWCDHSSLLLYIATPNSKFAGVEQPYQEQYQGDMSGYAAISANEHRSLRPSNIGQYSQANISRGSVPVVVFTTSSQWGGLVDHSGVTRVSQEIVSLCHNISSLVFRYFHEVLISCPQI